MVLLNGGCVAFYSASAAGKPTGVGTELVRSYLENAPAQKGCSHTDMVSSEWNPKAPTARRLLPPRALLAILSESSFCIFGGL